METIVDLNDTYWDRLVGYVTELRVDARWVLRGLTDKKSYGSLRIVSHPDLPPGQLRAYFTYVTLLLGVPAKTKSQISVEFDGTVAIEA